MGRPSALARAVPIDALRNATDADIAARFHPLVAGGVRRLPSGDQVFHGLPFALGPASPSRRWLLLREPVTIDLGSGTEAASHLVVAHLVDTWRGDGDGDGGARPAGIAVGHVVPIGQPLARYTVLDAAGRSRTRIIRRRFEINDGLLGWGSAAFAAVPHLEHEVLDWRGPHPRQRRGRYAPAGQSGTLTIMPGTYGGNQVGMTDFVPSPADDVLLWLHTIELDAATPAVSLSLEPLGDGRPGSDVLLAAVTLFRGTADPLVRSPRLQLRIEDAPEPMRVDLGTVIRTRPVERSAHHPISGWGTPRADEPADARPQHGAIVDVSIAPDAVITLGDRHVPAAQLLAGGGDRGGSRGVSIVVLPPVRIPVDVSILDGPDGHPVPARVRFVSGDGRYLPPSGHRDEVNPGFFEDTGGDLVLGSAAYAYVPGRFSIDLPVGAVDVEVVGGFDRRPHLERIQVDPATRRLEVTLERTIDLHAGRWVTADSHVHFLAPSTALLQAAAEDVDVVNLLAAGWGDLYTNVTDLEWGSLRDPSGRRVVVVGTENRQNVLGHLALLGARRPTLPLASGGPPEGRLAGTLDVLLADWADRCRDAGGLTVAAHFPLPYAEIAADIVSGRIEAVETQALSPALDDPAVIEWYRYLNLGYRLPLLAGTDKMSSEVPIGAVRAYAHLQDDGDLTFERWAAAVRAGRTFVTSGPILELAVDGHEPGDVIPLRSPARLEVAVRARAAQPVIGDVELVVNGRVVAATHADDPATDLALHETVEIGAGSWIAARSRSPFQIESAFTSSMAAHTSPVYVDVRDRPIVAAPEDVAVVEAVIAGTRQWIAELAAVSEAVERARMVRFLDDSLDRLRRRAGG